MFACEAAALGRRFVYVLEGAGARARRRDRYKSNDRVEQTLTVAASFRRRAGRIMEPRRAKSASFYDPVKGQFYPASYKFVSNSLMPEGVT
jgi:5-carboxymethyl-2-hydroxymuconate isomerase